MNKTIALLFMFAIISTLHAQVVESKRIINVDSIGSKQQKNTSNKSESATYSNLKRFAANSEHMDSVVNKPHITTEVQRGSGNIKEDSIAAIKKIKDIDLKIELAKTERLQMQMEVAAKISSFNTSVDNPIYIANERRFEEQMKANNTVLTNQIDSLVKLKQQIILCQKPNVSANSNNNDSLFKKQLQTLIGKNDSLVKTEVTTTKNVPVAIRDSETKQHYVITKKDSSITSTKYDLKSFESTINQIDSQSKTQPVVISLKDSFTSKQSTQFLATKDTSTHKAGESKKKQNKVNNKVTFKAVKVAGDITFAKPSKVVAKKDNTSVLKEIDSVGQKVTRNDSLLKNKVQDTKFVLSDSIKMVQKDSTILTSKVIKNVETSIKTPTIAMPVKQLIEADAETDVKQPFFRLWGDSTHKPTMLLRPFVENGIHYLKNSDLSQKYGTSSMYYYSFGFQIGHPETFTIIPFAQLTFTRYDIDKHVYLNTKLDSIFTMKQLSAGMILPIYRVKETTIRMKIGASLSVLKESFFSINEADLGVLLGFGIERKFIGNSRVYIDYTYLYQKAKSSNFKDFDMTRLAFGFIL